MRRLAQVLAVAALIAAGWLSNTSAEVVTLCPGP